MIRKTFGLLCVVFLAACNGDDQTVDFSGWEDASLTYSYPAQGQAAAPLHAPLVLRFSHALTSDDPAAGVSLETQDGTPVPFSASLEAQKRSLVLMPDDPLKPATEYVLRAGDQDTRVGAADFPDEGVRFRTRIEPEGAASEASTDSDFRVERLIPGGDNRPLVDFASLRLRFTQPVARDSLNYGDSVRFENSAGQLVDAHVVGKGPYLTIDPVEDLTPGETYHLKLTGDLRSTLDRALMPGDFADRELTPSDSGPGATLVQKVNLSNDHEADRCGPDTSGDRLSPLTGQPINCVPIASRLLGDNTSSQQQGDVHADLASLNLYPEMTPMRIDRGSLLSGASVDVKIAGEIPARFGHGDASSGEISVRFVSDATGYMMRNPYSDAEEAPRHIRLFMDVAMNTAETEPNASLSQDLMHLELVGTAIIRDGRMKVDAVGVVEPEVLGLETAHGTLSFHMESYRDQDNAPQPEPDSDAPVVQSWAPGDHAGKHRPGDPITVNFNEPMDRTSLAQDGALELYKNGSLLPDSDYDWYLDGAALVIEPDEGLRFGSDYEVDLSSFMAKDMAGNALKAQRNGSSWDGKLSFSMPEYLGGGAAPIALTAYPGFPCTKADGTLDLANNDQGRCLGGENGDDHLPVMDLPANRAISVQFSQNMNPDSIVLGENCGEGSFRVERVETDGAGNPVVDGDNRGVCAEAVGGRLDKDERKLTFTPDEPWQDDVLYRYTLMSEDENFEAGDCTRAQTQPGAHDVAICSSADRGLQTAMLDGPEPDQGGPDMENYFRGASATKSVLQSLRNLPASDVNANYVHESGEPQPQPDPDNPGEFLVPQNAAEIFVASTGGLLQDANVGCSVGEQCPDNKFLHVTGGLDAEVVGYEPAEDAVRVNVFPTLIMTSSINTFADIALLGEDEIPTGAQVMRVRYEDRGDGRTAPVTGWIRDTAEGPILEISLEVYMSAPYLAPEALGIELEHDLYSYPLTLQLSGPITFLEDGRMQIEQFNVVAPDNIDVELSLLGIGAANMSLGMPEGGVNLNYTSLPVKE